VVSSSVSFRYRHFDMPIHSWWLYETFERDRDTANATFLTLHMSEDGGIINHILGIRRSQGWQNRRRGSERRSGERARGRRSAHGLHTGRSRNEGKMQSGRLRGLMLDQQPQFRFMRGERYGAFWE